MLRPEAREQQRKQFQDLPRRLRDEIQVERPERVPGIARLNEGEQTMKYPALKRPSPE